MYLSLVIVICGDIMANWITHNEDNPFEIYGECSECGFEQSLSDKLKYCPNCGVKMTFDSEVNAMTRDELKNTIKGKIGLKADCILESDEERQFVWKLIEERDRYGWHNLIKDSNDLPKKVVLMILHISTMKALIEYFICLCILIRLEESLLLHLLLK